MADYFIFRHPRDAGDYCAIHELPDEFPDPWMPSDGERMGDEYGAPADLSMSSESPGILLSDVISNILGYLIVSPALRALLEEHSGAEIEFLPVRILNHKGRLASDEYSIANVIGTVDCVDMARSEGRLDPGESGVFARLKKLHLDPGRVPPEGRLFRIAAMPPVMIIRDDLRRILEDAGITGAEYLTLGEPVNIIA